jgi:hypothetical protein
VTKYKEIWFENLDIKREVTVENDDEDDDNDGDEMKEREESDARIGTEKKI